MRITWDQIEHQIFLSLFLLCVVFVTSGDLDPGGGGEDSSIKRTGVYLSQILRKALRGVQVKFCGRGLKLFHP